MEIWLKGTSWHHSVPVNDPVNDRPKLMNDHTANDCPNPVNVRTRACKTRKSQFFTANLNFQSPNWTGRLTYHYN
jgi:hypothetical protein